MTFTFDKPEWKFQKALILINSLPDDKILDRSKLKQSADDNSKFHEKRRKLSKRVENTVGKGEIACYVQFLLFPQCFQKACFPGASKGVIVWEWVKENSCVTMYYNRSKIIGTTIWIRIWP